MGAAGSGKSTKSQLIVAQEKNCIRVNRDRLREMCYAFHPSRSKKYWESYDLAEREANITRIEMGFIRSAVEADCTVVIDNMNVNWNYINRYVNLAKELNIPYCMKVVDTSLSRCLAQDKARERSVGPDLVERTYYDLKNIMKDTRFEKIFKPY